MHAGNSTFTCRWARLAVQTGCLAVHTGRREGSPTVQAAEARAASASRHTARAAKRRGVVMAVSWGGPAGAGGGERGGVSGSPVGELGKPGRGRAAAEPRQGPAAACRHRAGAAGAAAHLGRAARAGGGVGRGAGEGWGAGRERGVRAWDALTAGEEERWKERMEWLQRRWGRLCSAGGGPARSRTPVADGRMARRGRLGAAAGMGPPDGRGGIPGPFAWGRRGARCRAETQGHSTRKTAGGR